MKILVAIKRVIDPYVKIRVKSDETEVETAGVKMAMNPFDEIAVEEALRIKEAGAATEVVVVSIGQDVCQETLRHALALGADRAILMRTEAGLCSLSVAKILEKVAHDEEVGLVLMGKQSIDGDNNQTPQMLAALLDWPQVTYASKIVFTSDGVDVTREIDGGLETIAVTLPAVISTDLRLNEPRYASLPNIMKSKQKPLDVREVSTLNLALKEHLRVLSVKPPMARVGGIKVTSVQELVDKLRLEAKVI
jgi:electron transfer flavoprotein beta subunit